MSLFKKLAPAYTLVLAAFLAMALLGDRAVTVFAENTAQKNSPVFIIDPGHGGIDGGATSCTGVPESQFNLEIALRLNDFMRILGHETVMIRTTDKSVYTSGSSIAAQKVSDLKQRVKMVNETENGILVSIHQNIFSDGRYSGGQVFYAPDEVSREVAASLQKAFVRELNPGSNRKCKKADGIYLMEHISQPGVLIECGFLSNIEEEGRLRSKDYQQKLCAVIAVTLSSHFAKGSNLP